MKHLFLDTSFFEANNFFKGTLSDLYMYEREGFVKLYTNDIVINEVKNRIKEKMRIVKSDFDKLLRKSECHILGNTSYSKFTSDIKNKQYFHEEINKLCAMFDENIKQMSFVIIPYDDIDLKKIVQDYFSENPPFKEGMKKSEFPDAFILSSIEKYCEQNDINMIAISKDNDWLEYSSKRFEILNDVKAVFSDIIKEQEMLNIITHVYCLMKKNKSKIESEIIKYINECGYFKNSDHYESEVSLFTITDLELVSDSIDYTYIDNKYAKLNIDICVGLTADITFPDYENAIWDKEDEIYYCIENVTNCYDFSVSVDVVLSIDFDLEDDSLFKCNIESINNDNPIELTIDSSFE